MNNIEDTIGSIKISIRYSYRYLVCNSVDIVVWNLFKSLFVNSVRDLVLKSVLDSVNNLIGILIRNLVWDSIDKSQCNISQRNSILKELTK